MFKGPRPLTTWPLPDALLLRLGRITTAWAIVEEAASELFSIILNSARGGPVAFRAIVSTEARINVMRKVLEHKSPAATFYHQGFDRLVDEFDRLNGMRNKYVHWSWFYHEPTATPYIRRNTGDSYDRSFVRVPWDDLDDFYLQMRRFEADVEILRWDGDQDKAEFWDGVIKRLAFELKAAPRPQAP